MPDLFRARVIEGINDLATLKPELVQEWSEKDEIKPTEVSIGSHIQADDNQTGRECITLAFAVS